MIIILSATFLVCILIYIGIYPSISRSLGITKKTKEDSFEISRHIVNTLSFWIPSITVFCLVFFLVKDFKRVPLIGVPISLIPALFAGGIGLIIGNHINIDKADTLEIPPDNPMVQNEKMKEKIGIFSMFTAGISSYQHTKKAVKDITNVDSWKEFK